MESESQVVGELPVLRTPVDWHPWIGLIRKITVMEGIWVYMDPDLEEQPKVPKRRSYKLPTPCSVSDGKAKHPSELTVWQKWGTLSASFGHLTAMSSAPAKGVRTRLVNLSTSIRRSVHKRYKANTPTPWAMLHALQRKVKPSDWYLKKVAVRRYREVQSRRLRAKDRPTSVMKLTTEWGLAVQECKSLDQGLTDFELHFLWMTLTLVQLVNQIGKKLEQIGRLDDGS